MYLSNRLTFSLASLVLIFAFAAVIPVMAHIDTTEDGHESGDAADHIPHAVVKSITAPEWTNGDDFEVTIVFEAANTANEVIVPAAALASGNVTSTSGTVEFAAPLPGADLTTQTLTITGATADATIEVADAYAFTAAAPTGTPTPPDPLRPTVMFDGTAPVFTVAVDTEAPFTLKPGTADTLMGAFTVLVTVTGETDDSSSVMIKLSVAPAGKATLDPADGMLVLGNPFFGTRPPSYTGEYRATVTPASDFTGTLSFTVVATDEAGNESESVGGTPTSFVQVKVEGTGAAPAAFDKASPEDMDDIAAGSTVTVTFDKDPGTVTGTINDVAATVEGSSTTRTVTIPTTATGSITIKLMWATDKTQSLTYTIVEAAPAQVEVPAKSYVIIAKDEDGVLGLPSSFPANTAAGSSVTTKKEWMDMPNLEDLFFRGGSLLLTTLKATKLNRTNDDDATNDEPAKLRDVVITEIMAARNTAKVGQDGYLSHQWIELYNTLPVPVTVSLSSKSGTPEPTPADTEVQLDLASNVVVGNRWGFDLGDDGSVDGDPETTDNPFVSFFRSNRGADGFKKDSWGTSTEIYLTGTDGTHKGTPGAIERKAQTLVTASVLKYDSVIINEVGNSSNDDHDWIEIYNPTGGNVNIKEWHIGTITAKAADNVLVKFPKDDHYTIKSKQTILIVATDPYDDPDHPILAGTKWNKGQARIGAPAATSTYYVDSGLKLDNGGDYLLVLREGGYDAAKPDEKIKDLTGAKSITDVAFDTKYWPLKGAGAPHDDVFHDALAEKFEGNKVYHRNVTNNGKAEHNWMEAGFSGLGYKRSHEQGSKGSPGYRPDTKEKSSDLTDASVSISEIMYETATNTPQWIELYNNSATQSVNLNEWKLKFENADGVDIRTPAVTTGNLPGKILLPKQTVLIVSRRTGSHSRVSTGNDDFPDTRIINLWDHRDRLEVSNQNYQLLSTKAFRVTLIEKGGMEVDFAGNMGDDGEAMWALPASEKGEGRSSIIRRYDAADMPMDGDAPAWFGNGSIDGQEELEGGKGTAGWVFAAESSNNLGLYYGRRTDFGTPGFRATGPLPVSLSKFRPERQADGSIIVRWITESELDNAGFNILRSDTRDGEFTKLNASLIAGQGTTSERNTYKFVDTTAKPNVVYYYQIQDVSLDGDVQTLRTTHLRGNVTPAGKLTTTWGDIKALQ